MDLDSNTNVSVSLAPGQKPNFCLSRNSSLVVQMLDLGDMRTVTLLQIRAGKDRNIYLDVSDLESGALMTLVMPSAQAPPRCPVS